MKDLKIIFQKENEKQEFLLQWNEFLGGYMSELLDTKQYLQVENSVCNELLKRKYQNCENIDFSMLRDEANKILFSNFKELWNKYNDNYKCISCQVKAECLNCGEYEYREIERDGLGSFCMCNSCESTFDVEV